MGRREFLAKLGMGALALFLPGLSGCFNSLPFDEDKWRRAIDGSDPSRLYASHRDKEGRFFNPWMPQERSFWRLLRWGFSRSSMGHLYGQEPPTPTQALDPAYLQDAAAPASLAWVGHATFLISWQGQTILTDPFFGERAFIPARLTPPALSPARIPSGSIVIISHNHYDHLDKESVEALAPSCIFLCPLGLRGLLREWGAKETAECDWWQSVRIGGTRFTCLPAQHWSRRLGQDYNQSLWCAWMMERKGKKVFFGADSGYFVGYKEIGRRFPGIDAALLPVGAYEPRWFMHYAHMNVPEMLQAALDLGALRVVPTQWGVLKLGDEPATWPLVELKRRIKLDPNLAQSIKILPVGGRLLL